MQTTTVKVDGVEAKGWVIPLPVFNLVFLQAPRGVLVCGAFDVATMERFQYAAAKMKGAGGSIIASIEDLLNGEVREANGPAKALGIEPGQSGREALQRLGPAGQR